MATGQQFISTQYGLDHGSAESGKDWKYTSIANITHTFAEVMKKAPDAIGFTAIADPANGGSKLASKTEAYDDVGQAAKMVKAQAILDSHATWAADGFNHANKVYRMINFFDAMERRMVNLNNFLVSNKKE
jgi:hypothetical protein